MPQVVPAEIPDAGTFQGLSPGQGVGMPKRFPGIGKHPLAMFGKLPLQHVQRRGIQRYSDWLAVLGLTCSDPDMPHRQVHVRPLQAQYIGLSQSCGQREHNHVPLMRGQLTDKCFCLCHGYRPFPSRVFLEQVNGGAWRAVKRSPVSNARRAQKPASP